MQFFSSLPVIAPATPSVAESPCLRLGLIGFGALARQRIARFLDAAPVDDGLPRWELSGDPAAADAWWVNGSRIQLLDDGGLLVGSDDAGTPAMTLHLPDVDRPIAFSLPLAVPDFEAACQFCADDTASMRQALLRIELWLRPLAAQLCVAAQLYRRQHELTARIHHLHSDGQLLAVVDRRGDAAVRLNCDLPALQRARWSARPDSAAFFPESFARVSLSELMWQYAVRTREDLLPQRYRQGLIFRRRTPRLSPRALQDHHLRLLSQLSTEPATFAGLQQRLGMEATELARALAALYLVGAITSSPGRARRRDLAPAPPPRDRLAGLPLRQAQAEPACMASMQ